MSNWAKNKALAVTRDDTPTLCDQSQAKDADINIIIKMLGQSGVVPGAHGEPMYGDFTKFPTDLRGYIERGRQVEELMHRLPPQLKGKTEDEIMALTPQALNEILAPPKEETPKGETK